MRHTHFFLGANSADGFANLYDQLLDAELDDLLILKGGPGCGKSTFMRRVAAAMEQRGQETVYIHCSGDPDSLDGVIFPALRTAVADGTAPHVLEPRCMGARERYVDLSPCYDVARTKALRAELAAQTERYRAAYGEAYHILRALGGVDEERRALARAGLNEAKLLRRAAGIAAREWKGRSGREGREVNAFLGGVTCQGTLCRFDTADALCPRVYELCDSCGLAVPMLRTLERAARAAGQDAIVCRDPLRPAEPQHLLLPSLGLAFLTTNEDRPYRGKPYRRIRIDAMAEEGLTRAQRAHLRFIRRVRRALEEEAVGALARAKAGHDALEALYHPCVDFTRVQAMWEAETERLSGYMV